MIDPAAYQTLPYRFYSRSNVVQIAEELIGKLLITTIDGMQTAGRIVETEAYCGQTDRACHAYKRRTPRTEVMYAAGGRAYVYLCYGIHHLFNVVTNEVGKADAVLIRAIEPFAGVEIMETRRGSGLGYRLTSGPGSLARAMGIEREMSGSDLTQGPIRIAEGPSGNMGIVADRRVGVDYAGPDAALLWRFYVKDNPWVSRAQQSPLGNE